MDEWGNACADHEELEPGGDGRHCYHRHDGPGGYVCCWCGDCFVDDDNDHPTHGEYVPLVPAPADDLPEATTAARWRRDAEVLREVAARLPGDLGRHRQALLDAARDLERR